MLTKHGDKAENADMPKPTRGTTAPDDEITTRQALEILGYSHASTITRYVQSGKLTPARKLPGANGDYLFRRGDVEQLAADQKAAATG